MMIQLPSPSKVAAFDVDAQKGFTPLCPDELPVPEGHLIVAELNAQARFAGTRVFSKDSHPANPAWLATPEQPMLSPVEDRKSTRLNSSHVRISYAVFCLKKKKKIQT